MKKQDDTFAALDKLVYARFRQSMDTSPPLQSASVYRQMLFDVLEVRSGATLLDVGCGAGEDVQDLARLVGASGRVVGVDSNATMIQLAQARTADANLPVEYLQEDAYQLPFEENTFDGCQSARVFKHLAEPGLALAEMVRVARPGARIAVADADVDMTIVDIPDRALARKMIHLASDSVQQGWMGRQLPRLFSESGLIDIVTNVMVLPSDYDSLEMAFDGPLQAAHVAGKVSSEELNRFWDSLVQAERQQRFLGHICFVVGGRKP